VLQIELVEAMAKTAVGLFENSSSVEEVVRDLEASGFPQKDVSVLGEPREMAGSGVMWRSYGFRNGSERKGGRGC
jgi:hypothetical protein